MIFLETDIMKVEETKTYQNLDKIAKLMVDKSSSKRTIRDAVTIAKTIGVEKWEKITPLPNMWKGIVKELVL